METRFKIEGYWNEWSSQLMPWLLTHGIRILFIIAAAYVLNYVARRLMEKIVKVTVTAAYYQSEIAERKREETLTQIFTWCVKVLLVLTVFMLILSEIGLSVGPLLAGAGILGLAVGFGGQYLIRDFITGFFMIIENQYRIGDVVSLDQTSGVVEHISLRMTRLRDLDGTVHYVPHGDIKRVANLSMDFARINLNVRVAYQTQLEKAIEVINKTGMELAADPLWKEFIIKPPQFLRVEDFLESGIVLKILGETVPLKQWEITGELRKRIKVSFEHEGVEMPALQRFMNPLQDKGI
ncbi:MAG: mechanosensitive ion channel family protein [Saprospiraceae bacterium]|nr:mechanosensitive ion channel family protein [Saprospiraceae bacterium]